MNTELRCGRKVTDRAGVLSILVYSRLSFGAIMNVASVGVLGCGGNRGTPPTAARPISFGLEALGHIGCNTHHLLGLAFSALHIHPITYSLRLISYIPVLSLFRRDVVTYSGEQS